MDCPEFRDRLLAHVDDELVGQDAAAAQTHEADCTACAEQAAAERAFDDRVRQSLLAGVGAPDVAAMLAAADPDRLAVPAGGRSAGGRVVRLRRFGQAAAAAAALLVGFAWFNCLPPFECAYLQAVESAAAAAPAGVAPHRIAAPDEILGHARIGASDTVRVEYKRPVAALRARYDVGGETAVVVWAHSVGETPSFRRRVEIDGEVWWVAEEDGNTIVAYMSPVSDTLCSVIGPFSSEELRRFAAELRAGEAE